MGGASDDRDDLPPLPEADAWIVPDDARELEADRLAWLREERQRARRRRWERVFLTRLWGRYGLAGPFVVLVLVMVAAVGSLATLLAPRPTTPPPRSAPLATSAGPGGRPGGLLPDVAATRSDLPVTIPLRSVRPAVLAVVPPDCGCPQTLEHVFRQVDAYGLRLWLLASADTTTATRRVGQGIADGTVGTLTVPQQAVSAYAPHGVTLLLVAADGVVADVLRDVDPQLHAALQLATLDRPAASRP